MMVFKGKLALNFIWITLNEGAPFIYAQRNFDEMFIEPKNEKCSLNYVFFRPICLHFKKKIKIHLITNDEQTARAYKAKTQK